MTHRDRRAIEHTVARHVAQLAQSESSDASSSETSRSAPRSGPQSGTDRVATASSPWTQKASDLSSGEASSASESTASSATVLSHASYSDKSDDAGLADLWTGGQIPEFALVVHKPAPNTTLTMGKTYSLSWVCRASVVQSVKIDLFLRTQLVAPIAVSTPNNGVFAWKVPESVRVGSPRGAGLLPHRSSPSSLCSPVLGQLRLCCAAAAVSWLQSPCGAFAKGALFA